MPALKIILLYVLTLLTAINAYAQGACVTFGTAPGTELGRAIVKLSNGNYAIGAEPYIDGINLIITDPSFDLLVAKKYRLSQGNNTLLKTIDVFETLDSQLVLILGREYYDTYITKISLNGQIQWAKAFPGNRIIRARQSSVSGDIYGVGYYEGSPSRWDWLIARLTDAGTLVSALTIATPQQTTYYWTQARDLLETPDGGWLTGGIVMDSSGENYSGIIKLDSSLSFQWAKRFGTANNPFESVYKMQYTQDGGYLIGGQADSMSGYLIKLSVTYDVVWAKVLSIFNYYPVIPSGIVELDDGTIVLVSAFDNLGGITPIVLALFPNGDLKWVKRQSDASYGSVNFMYEILRPYDLTVDGNLAILATSTPGSQYDDIQVTVIDQNGNGCPTCFESPDPDVQVSNWPVTLEAFTPTLTNITSQIPVIDTTLDEVPENAQTTIRCQVSGIGQPDGDNPDPLQVINANGYALLKNTGQGDVSVWIYRIDGKRMVNKTIAPAGTVRLNLPPGVYLAVTNTSATGRKLLITHD